MTPAPYTAIAGREEADERLARVMSTSGFIEADERVEATGIAIAKKTSPRIAAVPRLAHRI